MTLLLHFLSDSVSDFDIYLPADIKSFWILNILSLIQKYCNCRGCFLHLFYASVLEAIQITEAFLWLKNLKATKGDWTLVFQLLVLSCFFLFFLFTNLCIGGCVFALVGWSVCLSAGLLKKLWMDFHLIFERPWNTKQLIRSWVVIVDSDLGIFFITLSTVTLQNMSLSVFAC